MLDLSIYAGDWLCTTIRVCIAMGSSSLMCTHRLLCLVAVVAVISLGFYIFIWKPTDELVLVSSEKRWNELQLLDYTYRGEQHATYVNNLEKCLVTSNLTEYFQQKGFLMKAVTNTMHYLDTVRTFIPHNFFTSLPNHCWNSDAALDFSRSSVSGHVGGINFRVKRKYFQSPTPPFESLNLLYGKSKTDYPPSYSMPFSCIPEVFILGFYKCGSTSLYSLLNSHSAFAKNVHT